MIVLVKILDERLKKCYGPFKHYSLEKAMMGEQKGLWQIISEKGKYKDKEMRPIRNESYLTKKNFKKGLTFADFFGEEKIKNGKNSTHTKK